MSIVTITPADCGLANLDLEIEVKSEKLRKRARSFLRRGYEIEVDHPFQITVRNQGWSPYSIRECRRLYIQPDTGRLVNLAVGWYYRWRDPTAPPAGYYEEPISVDPSYILACGGAL